MFSLFFVPPPPFSNFVLLNSCLAVISQRFLWTHHALPQAISKLGCVHDSCMHYKTHTHSQSHTRIRAPCIAHSHSQRNSQAWLPALTKTVYGRSQQVASVHISLIPLPVLCTLSPLTTHSLSSFFFWTHTLVHFLAPFPLVGTITLVQYKVSVHICLLQHARLSFITASREGVACVCVCLSEQERGRRYVKYSRNVILEHHRHQFKKAIGEFQANLKLTKANKHITPIIRALKWPPVCLIKDFKLLVNKSLSG